jgi:hypothetical protein
MHPARLADNGEIDADERGDLPRGDSRGADDGVSLDAARRRLDAEDLVAEDEDSVYLDALANSDTALGRSRRIALHDRLRRRVPVAGTVSCAPQAFCLERGHQLDHLVKRQLRREHAQRTLQSDRFVEAPDVVVRIEEEQVTDLAEVDVDAESLFEVAELDEREQGDADVELVRELGPDPTRRLARRAAPERVLLAENDVGDA